MPSETLQQLARRDPVMRRIIRTHGPCTLQPDTRCQPFQALARAIAQQQLNGAAAATILKRFTGLFPGRRFPRPQDLALVGDDVLRSVGFSGAKVAALRDLAAKSLDGTVPSSRIIARLDDAEIITRLTAVRGVGPWTAQMLLIFQLGRPDVLPADDFGVRSGYRHAYGLAEMPKPAVLLEFGERWRPCRTTATWYLWRVADAARENSMRPKKKAPASGQPARQADKSKGSSL